MQALRLSTMVSLSEHTSTFSTPAEVTEVSEISPSPTKVSETLPSKEIIQSEGKLLKFRQTVTNSRRGRVLRQPAGFHRDELKPIFKLIFLDFIFDR